MLRSFRLLSLIEGLSLITLFFIAMPAKYQFGFDQAVFYTGMTHGLLWFAYFVFSLAVSHAQRWSVMFWLAVLAASVIPFAFIFLDRKLRDEAPEEVPVTA